MKMESAAVLIVAIGSAGGAVLTYFTQRADRKVAANNRRLEAEEKKQARDSRSADEHIDDAIRANQDVANMYREMASEFSKMVQDIQKTAQQNQTQLMDEMQKIRVKLYATEETLQIERNERRSEKAEMMAEIAALRRQLTGIETNINDRGSHG